MNKYSEIKIDLHLHSRVSKKNGDFINWKSCFDAAKILHLNKVKLASFTDHNYFDFDLYKKMKKISNGEIVFIPGVEVDIKRKNGKKGHCLVLFSEKLSDSELMRLEQIIKENCYHNFKKGMSIQSFNNLFKDFSTIKIVHVGKSDYFSVEDLEELHYDAVEISSINHKNFLKYLKLKNIKSVVAFSDTHNWQKYPQQNKLFTFCKISPSFELLKKVIKNKKMVIKTENDKILEMEFKNV